MTVTMSYYYMLQKMDVEFILELVASSTERGLIKALHEKPDDEATRNAYVDFLLENSRDESAERVRKGYIPGLRTEKPKPFGYVASGGIASGTLMPYTVTSGALYSGAVLTSFIASGGINW